MEWSQGKRGVFPLARPRRRARQQAWLRDTQRRREAYGNIDGIGASLAKRTCPPMWPIVTQRVPRRCGVTMRRWFAKGAGFIVAGKPSTSPLHPTIRTAGKSRTPVSRQTSRGTAALAHPGRARTKMVRDGGAVEPSSTGHRVELGALPPKGTLEGGSHAHLARYCPRH
jgi:hypothetical protein